MISKLATGLVKIAKCHKKNQQQLKAKSKKKSKSHCSKITAKRSKLGAKRLTSKVKKAKQLKEMMG